MNRRYPRLFRGGWNALEPGDVTMLLDASSGGPARLYDVIHAVGLPLLGSGPGGLLVIWSQAAPAAVPAPYRPDANCAVGSLPGFCQPQALNLNPFELVQARIKIRLIDTSPASGAHVDNFDLLLENPGSTNYWGTNQNQAMLNARRQVGDPADSESAPLQDTNMGALSGASVDDGWTAAHTTEVFWYYNAPPRFSLAWNGAAAPPAGIGVGLEISGYRYLLADRQGGARQAIIAGKRVNLPDFVEKDDIVAIPISGAAAPSSGQG